jgi:hypothetical protein
MTESLLTNLVPIFGVGLAIVGGIAFAARKGALAAFGAGLGLGAVLATLASMAIAAALYG